MIDNGNFGGKGVKKNEKKVASKSTKGGGAGKTGKNSDGVHVEVILTLKLEGEFPKGGGGGRGEWVLSQKLEEAKGSMRGLWTWLCK